MQERTDDTYTEANFYLRDEDGDLEVSVTLTGLQAGVDVEPLADAVRDAHAPEDR